MHLSSINANLLQINFTPVKYSGCERRMSQIPCASERFAYRRIRSFVDDREDSFLVCVYRIGVRMEFARPIIAADITLPREPAQRCADRSRQVPSGCSRTNVLNCFLLWKTRPGSVRATGRRREQSMDHGKSHHCGIDSPRIRDRRRIHRSAHQCP